MPDRQLYQSDASYHRTLLELRRRVLAGVKLRWFDDDTPGNKTTGCTLGTCDDKLRGLRDGVYATNSQPCPHDRRFFEQNGLPTGLKERDGNGCFYTCRIFKAKKNDHETAGIRILKVTEGLA